MIAQHLRQRCQTRFLCRLCLLCFESRRLVLAEQFPTAVRSTGLSISYNLAVTIFGGFAPLIVTWLIASSGSKLAPSYYVMAAAIISVLALSLMHDRTGKPIEK